MSYILRTQLISIIFSFTGVIFADIMYFITYPSALLKYGQFIMIVLSILFGLLCMVFSKNVLQGRWLGSLFVIVPFIFYIKIMTFAQQLLLQNYILKMKMDFIMTLITPSLIISLVVGTILGIILGKGRKRQYAM